VGSSFAHARKAPQLAFSFCGRASNYRSDPVTLTTTNMPARKFTMAPELPEGFLYQPDFLTEAEETELPKHDPDSGLRTLQLSRLRREAADRDLRRRL